MKCQPLSDTASIYRLQRCELIRLSHPFVFECQNVFSFCFMNQSFLVVFAPVWIHFLPSIHVMNRDESHSHNCQTSCMFTYAHYSFIVLTCLWNSTGAPHSSPLLSSLPPHLLLCSCHSFFPPLREEKICHSLPLTAEWWTSQYWGLSFNRDQEDNLVLTLSLCFCLLVPVEDEDKGWEGTKSAPPNMKLEKS